MKLDASASLFERARKLMPGGVSSPVRAISPLPFYVARAKGPYLWDADDNRYIDHCLAYGPMILGHRHPAVLRAVAEQMENGWLFGTPTELEVRLAQEICSLYPSVDMLRFVSTGSEATMAAIRIARGASGRDKIVKIEGGFHGAHDCVLVKAGSGATTLGTPDSRGVPADTTRNTLQVPFNDLEAMEQVFRENRGQIAAVIMEPVLGNIGPVLPMPGYLEGVRALTSEYDILLIFDEVITGLRLAMGGAQSYYGVTPDLTTLGKIVGGGFPIGVVGGSRELMENVAPQGGVYQAGTFNGSPVSMAAGIATIEFMKQEQALERINATGDWLRKGLSEIVSDMGLGYSVTGIASMFKVFFGDLPMNYSQALKCDKAGYLRFFHRMLEAGVFLTPSQYETDFLSLAHHEEVVEKTLEAFKSNLKG